MHLLITSAGDVTSDLICERLAGTVLRLNWERWNEYSIDLHSMGFRVADRFGREVTESTIRNIIWRKPVSTVDTHPGESWYCFHEFKYAIQAIMEWTRQRNAAKLPIDPVHCTSVDKFTQLRVASKYVRVPEWHFTSTPTKHLSAPGEWIVKSVTGKPIPGTGDFSKVIYTTAIDPATLSEGFPWFIQRRIQAAYDLTIVFVDGKQFGFALDRHLFSGLDWRQSIGVREVDRACLYQIRSRL